MDAGLRTSKNQLGSSMLLERIKRVLTHGQTIFWLASLAMFAAYIWFSPDLALFFHRKITVTEQTVPGIVLVFALSVTSVWSYIFLLLPIYRKESLFDDKPTCWWVFHTIYWISIVLSAFFVFVYLVALSSEEETGAAAMAQAFEQVLTSPSIGGALYHYHLLVFVLLYTLMDMIVASASADTQIGQKFANVVIFIDTPILFTMCFIEFLFHPIIKTSFYYFEAGVVSFQLIASNFTVIALDIVAESFSGQPRS
jgi:hypothetical protein